MALQESKVYRTEKGSQKEIQPCTELSKNHATSFAADDNKCNKSD